MQSQTPTHEEEVANTAAYDLLVTRLDCLRPAMRNAVPHEMLGHSAFADGSFPIWWQWQPGSKAFISEAKPPAFVRFSNHPSKTYQGTLRGHGSVQCFGKERQDVAEALRDVVMGAFAEGEVVSINGLDVTVREVEAMGAFPVNGIFSIPVYISWSVSVPGSVTEVMAGPVS